MLLTTSNSKRCSFSKISQNKQTKTKKIYKPKYTKSLDHMPGLQSFHNMLQFTVQIQNHSASIWIYSLSMRSHLDNIKLCNKRMCPLHPKNSQTFWFRVCGWKETLIALATKERALLKRILKDTQGNCKVQNLPSTAKNGTTDPSGNCLQPAIKKVTNRIISFYQCFRSLSQS